MKQATEILSLWHVIIVQLFKASLMCLLYEALSLALLGKHQSIRGLWRQ